MTRRITRKHKMRSRDTKKRGGAHEWYVSKDEETRQIRNAINRINQLRNSSEKINEIPYLCSVLLRSRYVYKEQRFVQVALDKLNELKRERGVPVNTKDLIDYTIEHIEKYSGDRY